MTTVFVWVRSQEHGVEKCVWLVASPLFQSAVPDPSFPGRSLVLANRLSLKLNSHRSSARVVVHWGELTSMNPCGNCSLYYLEKEPIETDCRTVIYLVRPRLELMPLIAAQVSRRI